MHAHSVITHVTSISWSTSKKYMIPLVNMKISIVLCNSMSAICCSKPYEVLRLIYVLQYLKQAGVAIVALHTNEGTGTAAYKQSTQRKDQNMTI